MRTVCLKQLVIISALTAAIPLQHCWALNTALQFVSPNGGEQFHVGAAMSIQWTIDRTRIANGVGVHISPDSGISWVMISGSALLSNSDTSVYLGGSDTGTFTWTIPDSLSLTGDTAIALAGQNLLVGVIAPYEAAAAYDAASDGAVTILAAQQEEKKSGCGHGSGLALLVPIGIRVRSLVSTRKHRRLS